MGLPGKNPGSCTSYPTNPDKPARAGNRLRFALWHKCHGNQDLDFEIYPASGLLFFIFWWAIGPTA